MTPGVQNATGKQEREPQSAWGVRVGISWEVSVEFCLEG